MKYRDYKISVMYPGMHPTVHDVKGELYIGDTIYILTKEDGKKMYFPISLTVIIEL